MTMDGLVKRGSWKVGRELTGTGDGVEGSAGDVWQGEGGSTGQPWRVRQQVWRRGEREGGEWEGSGGRKERCRTDAYIRHARTYVVYVGVGVGEGEGVVVVVERWRWYIDSCMVDACMQPYYLHAT